MHLQENVELHWPGTCLGADRQILAGLGRYAGERRPQSEAVSESRRREMRPRSSSPKEVAAPSLQEDNNSQREHTSAEM